MKKCYRIENENGEGPFTYTVSKIFTDLQLKCFKGKKHPTPKFTVIDDAYFAFKNRATIDEWFDEAMRKELFKYGWFISVYKVKAYADEDEIQLQFLMAGAKLINTISLDY